MNISLLEEAVAKFKTDMENAIVTRSYRGVEYPNGQKAKEALIRSQTLINYIHEVVKVSLNEQLAASGREYSIHPPIKRSQPELNITGFIKAKDQDVVVLFDRDVPVPEKITEGFQEGGYDKVGKEQSERSIVIGVRSQLSSVAKNFDTLMERAFAETLNMRLRLPSLVMGEVYLLPVFEYADKAMENNIVDWKAKPVPVTKFIRTFLSISGRKPLERNEDLYKYERSALVLVDFRKNPPQIFLTLEELKSGGFVADTYSGGFSNLSPAHFAEDIIQTHQARHPAR